jgi:integrase
VSTHKPKGRPYYLYDFWMSGVRFHGSTKCASKRDADNFERERRKEAAEHLKASAGPSQGPMTFEVAATRYFDEVGQFAKTHDDIWRTIGWLQRELGPGRRIVRIDNAVVINLKTTRRQETTRTGGKVTAATVNRTLETLRAILTRAGRLWGQPVAQIDWRRHMLKEPDERVRELRPDEESSLFKALRPDYHAIVRFALMTGCRLAECVNLRWKDVDWGGRQIWILGKGDKLAPIPLPPAVRECLWPLQGEHEEFVFTYVAERTRDGRLKGDRYPITYEGLKTAFRRDVSPAISGYRFHDNRHTAATRVLRACGNLKVAQKLLRHSDIATTAKYAHVMHDDVLAAMEQAARGAVAPSPNESPDIAASGTASK